MMVLFTSRSEKKALLTVRRILDQFADRIGNDTWQTIMTQEGVQEVRTLLRRSATKSTAVSCRWIRSRNRSQLLWVVGNRDKFNEDGMVPVNTTRKNILHKEWEGGWPYLSVLKALVSVAALFHDWGKASDHFQQKLRSSSMEKDPYRHEWFSCQLLAAIANISGDTQNDDAWIRLFLEGKLKKTTLKNEMKKQGEQAHSLPSMPPIMRIIAWLILSHHRMPVTRNDMECKMCAEKPPLSLEGLFSAVKAGWGYEGVVPEKRNPCFSFSKGFLLDDDDWNKAVKKWLTRLLREKAQLQQLCSEANSALRPLLLYAREALMLADHFVSSQKCQTDVPVDEQKKVLYANTDGDKLCDKLSSHLIRVAAQAVNIAHQLPLFASEMDVADTVRFTPAKAPYQWQDKAVRKIQSTKQDGMEQAWFILNMASTGCGKTTANAKLMQALSPDGKTMRYTLALGLRSLTLQTGSEYRERMHLTKDELAVIIGSQAIAELYHQKQKVDDADPGKESSRCEIGGSGEEELLEDMISFEDNFTHEQLKYLDIYLDGRKNPQAKKNGAFLFKPILVATIDQIIRATEVTRGGKGLLPFLRMMSSDLVIDEVDDFSPEDLTAVARLVHLAGMLGRNVILSSATIPPDLAQGLYQAYQDGLCSYNAFSNRAKTMNAVWVDEFRSASAVIPLQQSKQYGLAHEKFVEQRVKNLQMQVVKRKAFVIPCQPQTTKETSWQLYVAAAKQAVLQLHDAHHVVDEKTGKEVSFGLMRFANIDPCVNMTLSLLSADWPEDTAVFIMCYHSRQVLLLRHEQEVYLDHVLRRKQECGAKVAFQDVVLRRHLDHGQMKRCIFLVVATPVEEIGRDHDFDWAVVEPSSYRSIIQLAGRVHRHRPCLQDVSVPNIGVMEFNWRGMVDSGRNAVFCRPGFEKNPDYLLDSHDMNDLIPADNWNHIDAIPRVQIPKPLRPRSRLIDLEHQRLADWRSLDDEYPDTVGGWQQTGWWMTGQPQYLCPFRAGIPDRDLCYRYDASKGMLGFYERNSGEYVPCGDMYNLKPYPKEKLDAHRERFWLPRDYMASLQNQVARKSYSDEEEGEGLQRISERYGQLALPAYADESGRTYWYDDQLGVFHTLLNERKG